MAESVFEIELVAATKEAKRLRRQMARLPAVGADGPIGVAAAVSKEETLKTEADLDRAGALL